ncbi:hypothetical protein Ate02nite_95460 [Paractinoplanes tereljensis]|uniref:non-specific serine/threonine protein kinase n=1 Tax=Paractinoplanes tereljensis TaxID=571912 RepID=A0A919NZJ2_9ACTN|nr:hypothetical protein Ate02nite_95460 [Actinoplanes tereljensis]
MVRSDLAHNEEFLGRFRSEVTRARQVPPFCTAEVLDADVDHDPPYLVVEYVDGPNLSTVVREQGPLAESALHSAAVGIATALTAIHGAGVIHRDLKPANVLFALGGLKVIDFGIAQPLEATSQHTGTDQLVGTAAYMAPERFDEDPGLRVGPASDIFAWGAVVTFAGTGRTPFGGDSPPATAMRILTQPPALDGLPMPLRLIVARTLAKDPAERPTARELLDLLLAVAEPAPAPPTEPPRPPARRIKRLGIIALAVVALLAAGLAGYRLFPSGDDSVPQSVSSPATGTPSANPGTTGDQPAAGSPHPAAPIPDTPPSSSPSSSSPQPTRPASTRPTPAASSAPANTSGRNLALDGTATASSMEGTGLARQPSYAIDGDPGTRWSSGFSDPQWLRVDLGTTWPISEIRLNWENAHATAYRVELSTDGTAWKTVYSTTNGQAGETSVKVAKLSARYVRIYCTQRSTDYGDSLWELEVR